MQALPDDFDPTGTPAFLIARIARLLGRRNDALLADMGVTSAWVPILGALRQGESLSQKSLAERAEIGQPATAQMLARMEQQGFLVSTSDPNDGRARLYKLTQVARSKVVPAVAMIRDANEEVFGHLSKAKQRQLVALLREISDALVPDRHAERERAGQRRSPRSR